MTPASASTDTPMPAEIEAAPSTTPGPDPDPVGIDWVCIPAGPFLMGSDPQSDPLAYPDEQPQHTVHLSAFWISRTPVTNHQFTRFVQATHYTTAAEQAGAEYTFHQPHGPGSALNRAEAHHPVVQISWHDAVAFCRWAGGRLPTEAEWEKAARSSDGRLYPRGNQPPDVQWCNFDHAVGGPTPVDRHPAGASPYGVLDMAGNVWEWCRDGYAEDTYEQRANQVAQDPTGPDTGPSRVLRGGSWYNDRSAVRCAYRNWTYPGYAFDACIGFRVARSLHR